MKGFKQCDKGHYYKEELDSCNYCPKPGATASSQTGAGDKTQIFGANAAASSDGDKTIVVGQGGNSNPVVGESGTGGRKDLNKTFIQGFEPDEGGTSIPVAQPSRRIVGWIISYTLDPMGIDYRIYEGNNSIGRDVSNTIVILKDNAVSARHLTILCKKGQFYLKDEMASNGTFINGTEVEIGSPVSLKDGDEIRLGGSTTFIFKSSI
jgi:hypothetical protein